MPKITLISHFYNEEMLLPYWIRHHKDLFDQAILINHASTDSSVDIIKSMAPNWKVIDSSLQEFDALMTDFEVQKIEEQTAGWKVCLNTTEFLLGPLKDTIERSEGLGVKSIYPRAMIMVDEEPEKKLSTNISLIEQKPRGIPDSIIYNFIIRRSLRQLLKGLFKPGWRHVGRSRLIHCNRIAGYNVGRHSWVHQAKPIDDLTICWFGFSPWTQEGIDRKLGIQKKLPKSNLTWGGHHRISFKKLQKQNLRHRLLTKILGVNVVLK